MLPTQKRVTLKNIADVCGYSINTVSRALRNDTGLPAETLARIQNTAHELGYIRNNLASSLRSGKSHLIAIIAEDIQNPYYSIIISQLDVRLKQSGYHSMILCTQTTEDLMKKTENETERVNAEMINVAISHSVDGILFFPYNSASSLVAPIRQNHIPLILIGREIPHLTADIVRCDDYDGGYLSGQELCRLGHRRFLYIAGPENSTSHSDREKGFHDALTKHGVSPEAVRTIAFYDMLLAIREKKVMELLSPIDYTAIFSFNDHIAYPVIDCLRAANYRIPEDISLIGFDHIRTEVPYAIPLTSVSFQPQYDFADAVVRLLLERIENPDAKPKSVILPVTIYDEGTIGKCN